MSNRKIEMYQYRSIIYRLRKGETARQIAREGLAGRHKINSIKQIAEQRGWLKQDAKLPEDSILAQVFSSETKTVKQSKAEPYRKFITKAVHDGVNANVIHQRLIEQFNFSGAYDSVRRMAQKIKGSDISNLTIPLNFEIGEAVQVDFGKGPHLFDERINKEVDTWFFVMTLCWSRHQYVELIVHQDIETWLRCHQNAFIWFGGVPQKIIIDNAKCAITKACYYDPIVQRSYEDFAQEYGFIISACPPYDPQKKGRVESGVKYVKGNFVPLRDLKSLQYANQQLKKWVMIEAGMRCHGSTFKKPLELFKGVEQEKLQALANPLPEIAVWNKVILSRNCHVRYQYCDYSAPFELYSQTLWLKATPTIISIYHNHQCVAHHARCFEKGAKSTKQGHLPPKARYYLSRNASWCLKESKIIGENCELIIDELIHHSTRDLLRQAQGILALTELHGKVALENACQRGVAFNSYDYKTIKYILEKGLETPIENLNLSEELSRKIYQGGARFQRQAQEFIN